jgi:hypothetical protein
MEGAESILAEAMVKIILQMLILQTCRNVLYTHSHFFHFENLKEDYLQS